MNEAHIVILENQADAGATLALQQRIADALDAGHRAIVLDLRGAVIAGTATVSALCCALRHVARNDATISVVGVPQHVRRVLELCDIRGVAVRSADSEGDPPGTPLLLARPAATTAARA